MAFSTEERTKLINWVLDFMEADKTRTLQAACREIYVSPQTFDGWKKTWFTDEQKRRWAQAVTARRGAAHLPEKRGFSMAARHEILARINQKRRDGCTVPKALNGEPIALATYQRWGGPKLMKESC